MCLLQTVPFASAVEKKWCRWKAERKKDSAVMPAGINGGMHISTGCSEKPSTKLMARKMLSEGIISDKEYGQIDTIFREKYRPTLGTLFADISLTSGVKRVMYSSGRK